MPAFTAQCPTCKAKFKIPDDSLIGKKTHCKKCGGAMVLKPEGDAEPEEGESSITDEIRTLQPIASRRQSVSSKKAPPAPKEKSKAKPDRPKVKADKRVLMISLVATISLLIVVAFLMAAFIFLPQLFNSDVSPDGEDAPAVEADP
ncbi:hypothetical protein Pla110_31580 [Polystyrenella longa]|uniref:Zinc finger/thioredoxin putative domain-containing protein n=1 Tax=Polystyrenella longa TaxID=2528007 RepID=A0A518CQB2_9PLAN|nr:hypothetical protein [Polystyrenella longa]QDU81417.1 hypothetical protein Pla110_31580 [Polystyrenella longa]